MRRRRFLAAVSTATAAGLAGCPGSTGTDATPETTRPSAAETPTPSGTTNAPETPRTTKTKTRVTTASGGADSTLPTGETFRTSDGRALTVSDPAVHRLVLTPERVSHHLYHRVTAAPETQQYLTFTVAQTGFDVQTSDPPGIEADGWPASLSLGADVYGERYESGRTVVGRDNSATVGRVGIPVPVVDAPNAAVVWRRRDGPSPRWRLPDGVVEDLASEAGFEVRSVAVPDTVEYGGDVRVTFTVANTGNRTDRFLAKLDIRRGSLPLRGRRVTVPAGESVTHTTAISPDYYSETRELRVVFDWGREGRTATVEVVGGPTATPTSTG